MSNSEQCSSCGMPMNGPQDHAPGHPDSAFCVYCSTPDGKLKSFEESFARLVQWQMRKRGEDKVTAEKSTLVYMRTMPAWKDHPQVKI